MSQPSADPAGRTALVTGAGSGIGRATVRALVAAGARVALTGRRLEPLQALATELDETHDAEVLAMPCDVTDPGQVRAAMKFFTSALGPIEIVVTAAGQAHSASLAETTDEDIDRILDVNLRGALHVIRATAPAMVQARFGRIINIASTAAVRGYRFNALYSASKHALAGLTRSLSAELLPAGITVNAVCPGFTDTEIVDTAARAIAEKSGRTEAEARQTLANLNPLRRLVTPEEVAACVVWLASEGGAAVSGQSIILDGGTVPV